MLSSVQKKACPIFKHAVILRNLGHGAVLAVFRIFAHFYFYPRNVCGNYLSCGVFLCVIF